MWRLFNSVTRGTRNFRPRYCCTQDNRDDACNLPVYDKQPKSSLPCLVILRYYSSSEGVIKHKDRNAVWNDNVNYKTGCNNKLLLLFDIDPHACPWGSRWEKECHDFNRNYFNQDKRTCILVTHSIANAVGWGSVAAGVTWGLYNYLKIRFSCGTYSRDEDFKECHQDKSSTSCNRRYPEQRNYEHRSIQKWCLSHGIPSCNHSYPEQRNYEHRASQKWCPLHGILYHYDRSWIDHQTPDGKTTIQSDLSNIFNPEINRSLFTFLFTTTAEIVDQNEKKKERSSQVLLENVELEPQIGVDKQDLEQRNRERSIHDSGYSERGQENSSYSSSTQDDCSLCSHENVEDLVMVTPPLDHSKEETCNVEEECNERKIITEQHILGNDKHLYSSEHTSTGTKKSEQKLSVKEEVLIEDCSCCDSLQKDRSVSDQATVFKKEVSSPKQKASSAGIDEFSDGLKEILEAGRKDLNDFSTQFLGILEGNIGRSVSNENPDEAIDYFRAGALLGDPSSSFNLGLCYHLSRGVKQDLKKARELYEAASLAGHGWATYNLAVLLLEGQGGHADPLRAHALLVEAVKMGVHEAQLALKQMEELQEDSCSQSKGSSGNVQSEQRSSLGTVQSEPSLSTVFSQVWSSSYSTTDLDFLDNSFDECETSSSLRMDANGKLRFYLD